MCFRRGEDFQWTCSECGCEQPTSTLFEHEQSLERYQEADGWTEEAKCVSCAALNIVSVKRAVVYVVSAQAIKEGEVNGK